jgi:hypothetical protein
VIRAVLLLAATLQLAAPAAADESFKGLFKGKVREGLYEMTSTADLGDMPDVPPGERKQTRKTQACITAADLERGFDPRENPGCTVKDFKSSGDTVSYVVQCRDERNGEMTTRATMTFGPAGYRMDGKVEVSPKSGPAVSMAQQMEAKYLGPCGK